MPIDTEYAERFESFREGSLFESLRGDQRAFVRRVAFAHLLTFQEFRRLSEIARDLRLWGEPGLEWWWDTESSRTELEGPELKRHMLGRLEEHVAGLSRRPPRYPSRRADKPETRVAKPVVSRKSEKTIWGMCPVASEKTVCCNLRTIDAVENCVFGCSYCSVQTFYTGDVVFDDDFAQKLKDIHVERDRFYHFGTGQASDSLAWGNKNGVLDALCEFASDHPNVLLELKTKSNNIRYLVESDVPANVVCSWSLNTPVIIENEEHFTAGLDERIAAARAVADAGVGVAFHFHPMVHYEGWEIDYPGVAKRLLDTFAPQEVRFVSFGSVTLIKPVIKKIRKLGNPTRIHRAEFVPDPHGKLTYNDEIKVRMFGTMFESFAPWRKDVFIYLCMEKKSIWERSFGYVYSTNADFEADFGRHTLPRRR